MLPRDVQRPIQVINRLGKHCHDAEETQLNGQIYFARSVLRVEAGTAMNNVGEMRRAVQDFACTSHHIPLKRDGYKLTWRRYRVKPVW